MLEAILKNNFAIAFKAAEMLSSFFNAHKKAVHQ
jgi:hypothetical protein